MKIDKYLVAFAIVISIVIGGGYLFLPLSHNTVNLVSPENATWTQATNDTLQFTFNRTDTLTGIVNCTLYINHTYGNHQDGCGAGTNINFFSKILLDERNITWYVNATNGTTPNDVEQSPIRVLYVDRTSPAITLNAPTHLRAFAVNEVDVNYTATDSSSIGFLNVTIYVNGTANISEVWSGGNVLTGRKINFSDGAWNVYVNVTDNVTKTARSIQANFTTDATAPASISFVSPTPANLTSYNVSLVNWTFVNATFTEGLVSNCTLEWRNATGRTNISMAVRGTTHCEANVTGQGPEEARYVVIINDTTNNTARSIVRVVAFDSTTAPTISFDLPIESWNSSSATVNFSFSVSDRWTLQMSNCTVRVNITMNMSSYATATNLSNMSTYTISNPMNNTIYNMSVGGFVDNSTNNWSIECFDGIGNRALTGLRNFTIDSSTPSAIELTGTSPINAFNTTGTTILFNWTVNDTYTPTLNCSLNINGTTNVTVASVSTERTTFNVSSVFTDGTRTYNVSCSDKSGLGISTANREFTIDTTAPTLTLDKSLNISVSVNRSAYFNFTIEDANRYVNSCYSRVKYDDGTYGVNVTGTMTLANNTRRCNVTISGSDITKYGRVTFQLFGEDVLGNRGNVSDIDTQNWTVIQLRDSAWNLIMVDRNSTFNQTANLSTAITSVSRWNNTNKGYTTFVRNIESNTWQNLTDGDAVYVYNNQTINATIMRLWKADVAGGIAQTSNKTRIVSQGWNQVAVFNNSVMTASGACNLPLALSHALDNGTIRYVSFYAVNESRYFSFRCGFTFNSDVLIPKGYGFWMNLNGSLTGFNQTLTNWRD